MKHLKTYEEKLPPPSTWPKVGDWVILELTGHVYKNKSYADFLNNNVGQIKQFMKPNTIEIEFYKSIPGMINKQSNWWVIIDQIKMFSPHKEELEAILASKKYNL